MNYLAKKRGFTIIELLVVIVVVTILATIAVVSYRGVQNRANDSEQGADMTALAKSLKLFYTDKGYYPTSTQVADKAWALANLPALTADVYSSKLAGANQTVKASTNTIATDRVSLAPGYYLYGSSASYTLDSSGNFTSNTSCTSKCPTYVLVYKNATDNVFTYTYGN